MTSAPFQPYRESARTTLLRNFTIALIVAPIITRGHVARLPIAFLIALWPTLGGHFVEVFFLNVLRPRLGLSRGVHILTRLFTWFLGGALIALAMQLTATALSHFQPTRAPGIVFAALGFILLELFVHLILQIRELPNFYDKRA